jgi:hypothetical protein
MKGKKTAPFLTLNLLVEDENVEFSEVKNCYHGTFGKLTLNSDCYITEDVTNYSWVCSLFDTDVKDLADASSSTAGLQEQLTKTQNDETLYYNFQNKQSPTVFWIKVKNEKTFPGNEACKVSCPFLQPTCMKQVF